MGAAKSASSREKPLLIRPHFKFLMPSRHCAHTFLGADVSQGLNLAMPHEERGTQTRRDPLMETKSCPSTRRKPKLGPALRRLGHRVLFPGRCSMSCTWSRAHLSLSLPRAANTMCMTCPERESVSCLTDAKQSSQIPHPVRRMYENLASVFASWT